MEGRLGRFISRLKAARGPSSWTDLEQRMPEVRDIPRRHQDMLAGRRSVTSNPDGTVTPVRLNSPHS